MATTTPPFAVPSSLVTTMPVTPIAWLELLRLAHGVLADGRRRAPAAPRAARRHRASVMTRAIFASSSIRCDCVCSRPAVSAMRTSTPRAFADCSASKTTAAGSAPAACATTGTPLRSAQTCELLDGGGAERVAGGEHDRGPSSLSRRASLPIVVVLPEPLTPTTRITYGFLARSTASGRSTGFRIASRASASADSSARASASSARSTLRCRSDRMTSVASTPTSAASSRVSSSSSRASSMRRPCRRSATQELPRLTRARRRARNPLSVRRQGSRMAGFAMTNAAPPEATNVTACVCISVVAARLGFGAAVGLSNEPCEPALK